MKYLILALTLVCSIAHGSTEIAARELILSLKVGTEILLELPLVVRAASVYERSLLLETSKVTFQNGHSVEQTNSDSIFCELKIEESFTNDETLGPRTLVLLNKAEISQNKELRTKSLIMKVHNSVVSELRCTYPASRSDVVTVGDIKKVFAVDQKLRFQTSSEETE